MQKIKTFFARVKTMSFKRMRGYAKLIAAESGRSTFSILVDMVWCALRYGIGYLDYRIFGFGVIRGKNRRTFLTFNDNIRLRNALNDPEKQQIFEDKLQFNEYFKDQLGRGFINMATASDAAFAAFLADKPEVFVKKTGSFGGLGVRQIAIDKNTDAAALRAELLAEGFTLCEQAIVQHETMDELCPDSVNTIRMVTINRNGTITYMYSLVRMASGDGTRVDNISSGGMYCPVSAAGVITAPAFKDKPGVYFDEHPKTHTPFIGFEIPCFSEAVALVLAAAAVIPEVGYVGWDVAIAPGGPCLVEGNTLPAYDMCQNYRHLEHPGQGLLPKFKAVMGGDF